MVVQVTPDGAYSWRTDYQLLGATLAALLLLAAIFGEFSHGFYTFLRLFVTFAATAIAWRAHTEGKVVTALAGAIVAILFNPILPIELEQETWQPIDLATAAWFSWLALEGPAAAKQRPLLRFAPIAAAVVLLGLGLLIAVVAKKQEVPFDYDASESNAAVAEANPFEDLVPERSPEVRLADAFEAATGHRAAFTETKDTDVISTAPLKIIELPFGPALLTKREIKDGCHACQGAIGVFYLREEGAKTSVVGRWPEAVEGWGWGAPPAEWNLTDKFTSFPAIYASGGYMGQGILMESATLTELRPTGPITSDLIGTGFSDEGAIADNERPACVVKGTITNIHKDRSFDVVAQGSVKAVDHYIKQDGKFVAASKIDWGVPCDM